VVAALLTDREIAAAKALDAIVSEDRSGDPNDWLLRYAAAHNKLQAAKRAARRSVLLTVRRTYGRPDYVR
jgi:hypothetical protein